MKKQFSKLEFEKFELKLFKNGYIKTNQSYLSDDYYWYKRIVRDEEINRTVCSLLITVYDFSKYERYKDATPIHIEFIVNISRNVDERIETVVMTDKLNTLQEHEDFALDLFNFVLS